MEFWFVFFFFLNQAQVVYQAEIEVITAVIPSTGVDGLQG